jgi:hypothetical protein
MNDKSLSQNAVEILNSFLDQAPDACQKLINQRVEVPDNLVAPLTPIKVGDKSKLGVLGIINSILDSQGEDRIAVCFDETDSLVGFAPYKH